jgi:hypothetical protein
MPPVKKKSKPPVKKVSESKLRELADAAMADFKAEAKKRYDHAHAIYNKQDDDTQDALDRVTALLCQTARRNLWVSVGKRGDRLISQIPEETIYHNMHYMAVEILKDLAVMDIKVANFKWTDRLCALCGNEIESKPRKKAKKS